MNNCENKKHNNNLRFTVLYVECALAMVFVPLYIYERKNKQCHEDYAAVLFQAPAQPLCCNEGTCILFYFFFHFDENFFGCDLSEVLIASVIV